MRQRWYEREKDTNPREASETTFSTIFGPQITLPSTLSRGSLWMSVQLCISYPPESLENPLKVRFHTGELPDTLFEGSGPGCRSREIWTSLNAARSGARAGQAPARRGGFQDTNDVASTRRFCSSYGKAWRAKARAPELIIEGIHFFHANNAGYSGEDVQVALAVVA
ncbi:hypothetical protein BGZ60DRAFT_427113 [Tricladium varicosporioides]|nr:hypothetical protein BGZ60DRAFT_427113 [Hymenoscyphus varicosporioides]